MAWGAIAAIGAQVANKAYDVYKDHQAMSHADFWNRQNIAFQKEFAQNSIKWRVEDAKRAGVHPMAALGIQPASFSPVSSTLSYPSTSDFDASSFGQSIDRAIMAGKDKEARQQAEDFNDKFNNLQLEKLGAEIDLLRSEADSKRAVRKTAMTPPAPSTEITTPFGDQPDAPYSRPYGKTLYNLFVLARHGDTFTEAPHPDIADSITESAWKNIVASIDAEIAAGDGVIKPPLYLLHPDERKAVKEHRYEFVRIPGLGWKLDRNPSRPHPYHDKLSKYEKFVRKNSQRWSNGRKEVSGKIF